MESDAILETDRMYLFVTFFFCKYRVYAVNNVVSSLWVYDLLLLTCNLLVGEQNVDFAKTNSVQFQPNTCVVVAF